ncbi:hypothetical protein RCL1_002060 [Eukaryota sp. TZLM3-RCL]
MSLSSADEIIASTLTSFGASFDRALITHDETVAFRAARSAISRKKALTPAIVSHIVSNIIPQSSEFFSPLIDLLEIPSSQPPSSSETNAFRDCYAVLIVSLLLSRPEQSYSPSLLEKLSSLIQRAVSQYYAVRDVVPIIGYLHYYHFRILTLAKVSSSEIRDLLMKFYRSSVLSCDLFGKAVVINSLCFYLVKDKKFTELEHFLARCGFPIGLYPAQDARFHYYSALVAAIKLDYSEALSRVGFALRKTSSNAQIFRSIIHKLSIVLELVIGSTPRRSLFSDENFKSKLFPYYHLVKAVRGGSIEKFNSIVDSYRYQFEADGLLTLIDRLQSSVVRLGLRNILLSYSKISIVEVSKILGLSSESRPVIVGIVAKAIRDGVIEASIDGDYLIRSNSSISESGLSLDSLTSRIAFTLSLREEALKSLRYNAGVEAEKLDLDELEKDRKAEQEARKHAEDSADTYGEPGTGGW